MFCVLFEVQPHEEQRDSYLANATMLHPELQRARGFVDNIRYRSLTRDGWILSLSAWRDEASVFVWRARACVDEVQEGGWNEMLADYRLRVGEVTSDTRPPQGRETVEHGRDEIDVAAGTYVTLIDAKQTPEWVSSNNPEEIALYLGFDLYSYGDCISWDVLDDVFSPGEIMLMVTWKNAESANDHAATQIVPDDARVRVIRVVRDIRVIRDYATVGRGEPPATSSGRGGREDPPWLNRIW